MLTVHTKSLLVDKLEHMIGSYGPSAESHSVTFLTEEAPSGMLARGSYDVLSRIIDDDKQEHASEFMFCLTGILRSDWFHRIKNSNGPLRLPRSGRLLLSPDRNLRCSIHVSDNVLRNPIMTC
jgi:hypothetical protein